MRINKHLINQFVKFCFVGVVNTVVHFLVMIFFVEISKFNTILASSMGFVCAVIISYLLNNYWTFQSNSNSRKYLKEIKFTIVSFIGLGLNFSLLNVFNEIGEFDYIYNQFLVAICVTPINFILNKAWAFVGPKQEKSE